MDISLHTECSSSVRSVQTTNTQWALDEISDVHGQNIGLRNCENGLRSVSQGIDGHNPDNIYIYNMILFLKTFVFIVTLVLMMACSKQLKDHDKW